MRIAGAALLLAWALALGARAEPAFELHALPGPGRTALVELADLDGDGLSDLLTASFLALPPKEVRRLQVRFQRPDGSLPQEPDWEAPPPEGAAAYDLARLREGNATLLLLLRDRLALLSFAGRQLARRDLPLPGTSIALAPDERGIDRLRLVRADLGRDGEPRLLIPGLGECFLLTTAGELEARLSVGARANFLVPSQSGPMFNESEIEVYFDVPRLAVGDVDGDGRNDVIASRRHEIRVFLQREDGRFNERADRVHELRRLSEQDHIRNSGSVRVDARDFQGDGLTDLLIAQSSGGFLDAASEIALYVNRKGRWNLDAPDQVFRSQGGNVTHELIDLDGDGRPELVDARIPLGVLDLIEVLLTRGLDARISIRRTQDADGAGPFGAKPWFERQIGVAFSFERIRPSGFLPTLEADLNGDGQRDLLGSGGGRALEIHLADREQGFARRPIRQELDTAGRIAFGDFDADALTDLVIYDPRRPDSPIHLAINRGVLPGSHSRPALRAGE